MPTTLVVNNLVEFHVRLTTTEKYLHRQRKYAISGDEPSRDCVRTATIEIAALLKT